MKANQYPHRPVYFKIDRSSQQLPKYPVLHPDLSAQQFLGCLGGTKYEMGVGDGIFDHPVHEFLQAHEPEKNLKRMRQWPGCCFMSSLLCIASFARRRLLSAHHSRLSKEDRYPERMSSNGGLPMSPPKQEHGSSDSSQAPLARQTDCVAGQLCHLPWFRFPRRGRSWSFIQRLAAVVNHPSQDVFVDRPTPANTGQAGRQFREYQLVSCRRRTRMGSNIMMMARRGLHSLGDSTRENVWMNTRDERPF